MYTQVTQKKSDTVPGHRSAGESSSSTSTSSEVHPTRAGSAKQDHRRVHPCDGPRPRWTQVSESRPSLTWHCPRMQTCWPHFWPHITFGAVRIQLLTWSPLTESNRRLSPYHGYRQRPELASLALTRGDLLPDPRIYVCGRTALPTLRHLLPRGRSLLVGEDLVHRLGPGGDNRP